MIRDVVLELEARAFAEGAKFKKIYGRYPDDKEAERMARYLIEELKLGLAIHKTNNKVN